MPDRSAQKIPVDAWEIGAELLDILSRGLYSDAKDAVREYVQNGIDAGALRITVTVSGPALEVRDDGSGMDWDTLRRARRFGMSDKNPNLTVGYRGIGIYSSFGMCETLTISTRQSGAGDLLRLSLQFGEMRRLLEADKSADRRSGVALAELLYEYSEFDRLRYRGDQSESFTLVRLEGITPEYRAQLNDRSALYTYLLNTVPVAYPQAAYGNTVNDWIQAYAECRPVNVALRVGDEPEEIVTPAVAEGVGEPEREWIEDGRQHRLAFMWYALSGSVDRIKSDGGEDSGVSGFLLKSKGFTLGDRTTLKSLWPPQGGRTLYHHFTGEVHVLDAAKVYPNAARDDLEMSPERQVLVRHLQDTFRVLNTKADAQRQLLKIKNDLSGFSDALQRLSHEASDLDSDKLEVYRSARNFDDEIDASLRELQRLSRGKYGKVLTPEQVEHLQSLTSEAKTLQKSAASITAITGRQTATQESAAKAHGGGRAAHVPRAQTSVLEEAAAAIQAAADVQSEPLGSALRELEAAMRLGSLARAATALDELKATGFLLPERLEAARKEVRTRLRLAPSAPVSLLEALTAAGLAPSTPREEALVRAVDKGILQTLGSRGERYDAMLRAIVDSAGGEPDYR